MLQQMAVVMNLAGLIAGGAFLGKILVVKLGFPNFTIAVGSILGFIAGLVVIVRLGNRE